MCFHDLFYRAEVEQDPLGLRPATEYFRPPSGRFQDFPEEGANPKWGTNLLFDQTLKNAWMKKIRPGGAHQKFYYVDPPLTLHV